MSLFTYKADRDLPLLNQLMQVNPEDDIEMRVFVARVLYNITPDEEKELQQRLQAIQTALEQQTIPYILPGLVPLRQTPKRLLLRFPHEMFEGSSRYLGLKFLIPLAHDILSDLADRGRVRRDRYLMLRAGYCLTPPAPLAANWNEGKEYLEPGELFLGVEGDAFDFLHFQIILDLISLCRSPQNVRRCAWKDCGAPFVQKQTGRKQHFCSTRCRNRDTQGRLYGKDF